MLAKLFFMGGYAVYVWPAYAIVLAVLSINAVQTLFRLRGVYKCKNVSDE